MFVSILGTGSGSAGYHKEQHKNLGKLYFLFRGSERALNLT